MSGPKKMTLRVQSAEGTARVEAKDSEPLSALYERVQETLPAGVTFSLHRDRARRQPLARGPQLLRDAGLQHGDMLYLSAETAAIGHDDPSTSQPKQSQPLAPTAAGPSASALVEDDVDLQLYELPGSIQRQRDDKLCRHNSKGCCVHCSPLEPWDENYLKEHNIKHLSFHSYLRKITSGRFVSLEELSCKIKPGCREHPPWPRGICSACQPGAVTLTRQPYRHVDNVLVDNPALVERFLAYWRVTGHQRVGFLYGRYERHPDVPLGVRARVSAIYEPAQLCSRDEVRLLPDAKAEALAELAARRGLRRVGWLFTDLLPAERPGAVRCLRGLDSHFLSAQECIMAGHFQNQHPNVCRHASSGHFGSKFVTVCVTGDAEQRVHLEGYQVSGQCQALVRDGILLPTRDAPDLGYIRDSGDAQYVPDVYYKERDEYGNDVGVSAKRLPVAYLLVDVPCGVAASSATAAPPATFPPAHRAHPEHEQSPRALYAHVQAAASPLRALDDLHVLLYLATNEALPLRGAAMDELLTALEARDEAAAARWLGGAGPATLLAMGAAAGGAGAGPGPGPWTCRLCTFHNAAAAHCEMCGMPRDAGHDQP